MAAEELTAQRSILNTQYSILNTHFDTLPPLTRILIQMRMLTLVTAGVLLVSLTALAAGAQQQDKPKPKPKPKRERPIHRGNFVLVLPVIDGTTSNTEESDIRRLYARAGMLKAFTERKLDIVPQIIVQGIQDQEKVSLTDVENWTSDKFDKLAQDADCHYIAGAKLLSVADATMIANKKGITGMNAEVQLATWLYDAKLHQFLLENVKTDWTYTAKKGDEKLDQKAINYEAIVDAAEHAFKVAPLKK